MVMQHHDRSVVQKNLFALFTVKVTARAYMTKNMTLSTLSSKLLIVWQLNWV